MSRAFLHRVSVILEALQKANGRLPHEDHPINCNTIADGLEVSPRTIQRDLDFIRDDLRLPLEYEPTRRTFFLREPVKVNSLWLVVLAGEKGGV